MQEDTVKNVKLGIFVIAGLLLLILLLYLIGINRNLFGGHYELKAYFSQVNGLEVGNNVRFAGINAGTVDEVNMIDDSTVEVTMLLKKNFKGIIRKNAEASISTDGLVGNKIINIVPQKGVAALAASGDIILSKKNTDTEEMIRTLSVSNDNVKKITDTLLLLVSSVKNSGNMRYFLDDPSLQFHFSKTLKLMNAGMDHFQQSSQQLDKMLSDIESGKGDIGKLIKDTTLTAQLNKTIYSINEASDKLNTLIDTTERTIIMIQQRISDRNNPIGKLFNDTAMSNEIAAAVRHINLSAQHFNENMLALQQSIFLKKYFKKQKISAQ